MTSRVSSDLLLVGSLPVASSDEGMRAGAEYFGDLVPALSDGESGERGAWVGYERNRVFMPHPDVEVVERPVQGRPNHVYEAPVFQLRDGVTEVDLGDWSRIDEALESYRLFRSLREQGVIPSDVRFQVCLPFPSSAISGGFRRRHSADYPVVERAYEAMVQRGLERLLEHVPAEDLAIQWDMAYEVQDLESVLAWTDPKQAWERFVGPSRRLSPLIPEQVLLGYHLCYGTFPEWPMYEARDMGLLVRMANAAVETAGRPVDWVHMAGPRYLRSEEDAFFAPLADLSVPDTRVFLGIVLPLDGAAGLRRRHETASRHLDDFGVSMYCGFGRQPGEDGRETMRTHRDTVTSVRRA
ncbi:MAG TPA: hypothetical protein VK053_23810 [Jiangellaceae bacterium]|nr:hypothetical protein [Jiangellaceae bacterium]